MNFELNVDKFLTKLREIENVLAQDPDVCDWMTKQMALQNSTDSVLPILRTALVINWKESAMKKRVSHFLKCAPTTISSLAELNKILESTSAIEFCREYLLINTTRDNNPKYMLLKTLTTGFLEYQERLGIASEIGALRHWAEEVDLAALEKDPIGELSGVGPGVVENIRLNLGCNVIKPDRHVIKVLSEEFGLPPLAPCDYRELPISVGIPGFYLDRVLFKYGKLITAKQKDECASPKRHRAGRC